MNRLVLVKFCACCSIPLLALGCILTFVAISYIQMDQSVIIARKNVCPPSGISQIPKIMHHTWKDTNIPDKWKNSSDSCKNLNLNYKYMMWTDKDIEDFLAREYPWFLETYFSYPYPIQRIDSARLFMLYHYGGVYTDLDIICRHSFDYVLKNLSCHSLVFLETTPVGVTNMVIFAKPRHPFIKFCMDALARRNRYYGPQHFTVMLSAGPTFIADMMRYYPDMPDVFVFSREERHVLFGDLKGQSWHGPDTKVFTFIDKHLKMAILLIGTAIALVFYGIYKFCHHIKTPCEMWKILKGKCKHSYRVKVHDEFEKISLLMNGENTSYKNI